MSEILVALLAGAVLGVVATRLLWPRTVVERPRVVLDGPPAVGPRHGWPTERLVDRHIRHARLALQRERNTSASTEDALASAERFIAAARREMQRNSNETTTTASPAAAVKDLP